MRFAYVLGHPVSHSRSPELFARFAAATGVALTYERRDVAPDDLPAALDALRANPNVAGANVTLPHKTRALALADEATVLARATGAANVLTRLHDGRLLADNSDVTGIGAALRAAEVDVAGAHVVLLGAGGVARAAAAAVREARAAAITVCARDGGRASAFARDFDAAIAPLDLPPQGDLYVQCTPLGMVGQPQRSLLPRTTRAGDAAFETVYTPEVTPFVRDARARGMRVVLGTALFAAQAAATFERWFGIHPEVTSV